MIVKTTSFLMPKIAIRSYCWDDWGGSEDLWAKSIPYLLEERFGIMILKARINRSIPEYVQLSDKGVILTDLKPKQITKRAYNQAIINLNDFLLKHKLPFAKEAHRTTAFVKAIKAYNPSLVIIAQGINFDGLKDAYACHLLKIPYIVIAQKAVDFFWPPTQFREIMSVALKNAKKCFFVSNHNKRITEEQFGFRLHNAQVIFNPVKVRKEIVPYPSVDGGYKLACVARLFLLDKGQDILLRIMAEEKWRRRPITVSLIGGGQDTDALKALSKLLDNSNVEFVGYVSDIENLWHNYHALILPSRSEGLPLSMVEAMAAGRTVIVTDVGGNADFVKDGITGFIGQANEDSFDSAMERAWQNRQNWEAIGQKASQFVSSYVPELPEKDFADTLIQIAHE